MSSETGNAKTQDMGIFPDVDLVLVVDHKQSDRTRSQTVARYFRIHMDVEIDSDDVWKAVSEGLRDRDHAKIYRTLVAKPPTDLTKRGHNTLKAALGQ